MKRETIDPHFRNFVKGLEKQTKETIQLIVSNLSKESKLKEEDVSEILVDFLNKGATLAKAGYTCPVCNNKPVECPSCDAFVKELKGEEI